MIELGFWVWLGSHFVNIALGVAALSFILGIAVVIFALLKRRNHARRR